jgi:hypothetical protein
VTLATASLHHISFAQAANRRLSIAASCNVDLRTILRILSDHVGQQMSFDWQSFPFRFGVRIERVIGSLLAINCSYNTRRQRT